jgi:hypothetical protein
VSEEYISDTSPFNNFPIQLPEMILEQYNESDREKETDKAGYAQSESSERISEAPSLPVGDTHKSRRSRATLFVAPESINTKVLMARSIAL